MEPRIRRARLLALLAVGLATSAPAWAGDKDKDGIKNKSDACPTEPEDWDGFQDADGCPDIDNDLDGVLDVADLCPNEPETKNGHQDEDGCPDADPNTSTGGELPCFLTTAAVGRRGLADDGPELGAMRRFRDGWMRAHPVARRDVEDYDRVAPGIVAAVSARTDAGEIWDAVWEDYLQPVLAMLEAGEHERAWRAYRALVRDLRAGLGA